MQDGEPVSENGCVITIVYSTFGDRARGSRVARREFRLPLLHGSARETGPVSPRVNIYVCLFSRRNVRPRGGRFSSGPRAFPFIIQVKESGRVFLLNVNQRGEFLCPLARNFRSSCASCRVVPHRYSSFNFRTWNNLPSLFNVGRPTDCVSNLDSLGKLDVTYAFYFLFSSFFFFRQWRTITRVYDEKFHG